MATDASVAAQTRSGSGAADVTTVVKPVDAWWTVLVIDPLAMRLVPILLRWKVVTANLLTSLAFLVGVGAVTAFGFGHFMMGALLYELRFLLDCLDGKVARARHATSTLGEVFDHAADALTMPAAYAAVGLALAHQGLIDARLALLPALMSCLVNVLGFLLDVARTRSAPGRDSWLLGSGDRVGWFRRHRLMLVPSTIEAETLGLFLAPLIVSGLWLGRAELVVAGLYGALGLVNLWLTVKAAMKPET